MSYKVFSVLVKQRYTYLYEHYNNNSGYPRIIRIAESFFID